MLYFHEYISRLTNSTQMPRHLAAGRRNIRQTDVGLVVDLVFGCSTFVLVDILQLLLEMFHQLGFRSECLYVRILPRGLFPNGQNTFRAFV